MDRTGEIIKCKAAVAWELNKPMTIEEVEIHPPKADEVRIKVIASAICRSDLNALNGHFKGINFPIVLGHESAGIVESVGAGVTDIVKGDRVVPCFIAQCKNCRVCRSSKGNYCAFVPFSPFMRDGTSRIRCKGKVIHHFANCSTFAEYAVIAIANLAKVSKEAPLEKVCLLGCGVATGIGAARKVAKVTPGSTCAVWGLGAIGLGTVIGCQKSGASRIIAIDVNSSKSEIAKVMGATEFFNPMEHSRPIHEVLKEMTGGGLDYAFECVGNGATITQAVESCHHSLGTCVMVGVPDIEHIVEVKALDLLAGKTLTGTFYGGLKPRDDIPKLVDEYMDKKLPLDELITKQTPLEEINEGFKSLKDGNVIRVVLRIGDI